VDTPIARPVDDFFQWLKKGFDVDWDDALKFMPFDGDDWAIPGASSSARLSGRSLASRTRNRRA
jgi:hypothetical protein